MGSQGSTPFEFASGHTWPFSARPARPAALSSSGSAYVYWYVLSGGAGCLSWPCASQGRTDVWARLHCLTSPAPHRLHPWACTGGCCSYAFPWGLVPVCKPRTASVTGIWLWIAWTPANNHLKVGGTAHVTITCVCCGDGPEVLSKPYSAGDALHIRTSMQYEHSQCAMRAAYIGAQNATRPFPQACFHIAQNRAACECNLHLDPDTPHMALGSPAHTGHNATHAHKAMQPHSMQPTRVQQTQAAHTVQPVVLSAAQAASTRISSGQGAHTAHNTLFALHTPLRQATRTLHAVCATVGHPTCSVVSP